MARCFITGVELPLGETRVLDIAAAYRALRELRHRAASIERLIQQLSHYDEVEAYDAAKKEIYTRKDRRLICPRAAELMSAVYPGGGLFITWGEWRARRQRLKTSWDAEIDTTTALKDMTLADPIPENGKDIIPA
jgi:hypothetical protein